MRQDMHKLSMLSLQAGGNLPLQRCLWPCASLHTSAARARDARPAHGMSTQASRHTLELLQAVGAHCSASIGRRGAPGQVQGVPQPLRGVGGPWRVWHRGHRADEHGPAQLPRPCCVVPPDPDLVLGARLQAPCRADAFGALHQQAMLQSPVRRRVQGPSACMSPAASHGLRVVGDSWTVLHASLGTESCSLQPQGPVRAAEDLALEASIQPGAARHCQDKLLTL